MPRENKNAYGKYLDLRMGHSYIAKVDLSRKKRTLRNFGERGALRGKMKWLRNAARKMHFPSSPGARIFQLDLYNHPAVEYASEVGQNPIESFVEG